MNQQPFGLPPQWWPPKMSLRWVRWTRGYRRWQLKGQGIVAVETRGEAHLLQAAKQGGVLLAPNHSTHYDSNALYTAADGLGLPLYFMTAWQVFAMSTAWQRFLMQRVGCFSVDRESNDRKAMTEAVRVLREKSYPLVIFPEGDIYHTNERVTAFREGAGAIALMAARKSHRPVQVVPCAIKFSYEDDPSPLLSATVAEMEERLFLRTDPATSLIQRIHRLAEASLALKELDVLGATRGGRIRERIPFLLDALLDQLETRFLHPPGKTAAAQARPIVPQRVKRLRQEIIRQGNAAESAHDRQLLRTAMNDLFLAIQLYSYPGDYLAHSPSLERVAETVDKLEEDILLRDSPSVRGSRRVVICFGEPIPVSAAPARRPQAAQQLTDLMQQRVQQMLDGLIR